MQLDISIPGLDDLLSKAKKTQGVESSQLPTPLCGRTPSPTQQYITAPTPIIAEKLPFYKGALCLYICGVGFYIPRRFLFASMGTPAGGREGKYHPRGKYH